jgi:hypothetical protein
VSSGFYHRIAFALPFGLACTHAGVWQCRPAVTLSGRSTSGARFRASVVPSFSGPLQQPGAGIPANTDEMYVVLHLLSHGASWRTLDYYGHVYAQPDFLGNDQTVSGSWRADRFIAQLARQVLALGGDPTLLDTHSDYMRAGIRIALQHHAD